MMGAEPAPGSTEPSGTSHRSLELWVSPTRRWDGGTACVPKSSLSSEDAAYVSHYPRAATAPDRVHQGISPKGPLSCLGGVTGPNLQTRSPREEE